MSRQLLTAARIRELFGLLDEELRAADVIGELHVVGGAVMCLVFGARDATRDVDALMRPAAAVRAAAARVADAVGEQSDWLNDAVVGFLTPTAEFDPFLELPNLRVFVARPEYLLALKCAAMRLGGEFHDLDDVRFLLRALNITTSAGALEVITQYVDEARLQPKARFALEELLGG
jgi:hypothetical protein